MLGFPNSPVHDLSSYGMIARSVPIGSNLPIQKSDHRIHEFASFVIQQQADANRPVGPATRAAAVLTEFPGR